MLFSIVDIASEIIYILPDYRSFQIVLHNTGGYQGTVVQFIKEVTMKYSTAFFLSIAMFIYSAGKTDARPIVYAANSAAVVDTPKFSIPFSINQHDYLSYGLNFGIYPGATKGIDASLGEQEYPPFPPGGGMAMFLTDGGNSILDIRGYTSASQADTFNIGMNFDESDTNLFPIVFSWPNLSAFYSGSVRLKSSNPSFDIDMKSQTSFTLDSAHLSPFGLFMIVTITAEGPLPGSSLPVVSTYGLGNGGFQAIVHAPIGATADPGSTFGVVTGTSTWFEYGPTKSYGSTTTPQTVGSGTSQIVFSPFDPGSLPPNTRYHFRAVGQNTLGTFYGEDQVVSNGTPPPEVAADTTKYRTATYRDWADAKDAKGKRKSIKCKPDKVDFQFDLTAPFDTAFLTLKFSMLHSTDIHLDTAAVYSDTLEKDINMFGVIQSSQTVHVSGTGVKGQRIKISYLWVSGPKTHPKVKGTVTNFIVNQPRLPMPNLHNVGEDIFGGVMQTPVTLTVGTNSDPNGAHTVFLPKYKDVLKSLVKEQKGGDLYHTKLPHCLNNFDKTGKDILKRQKGLPPDKHNNSLFAEQLTLRLNIAASDSGLFPEGLGDLIYHNSSPFDGLTIRAIADSVDKYLGCNGSVSGTNDSTEFLKADSLIDAAFAGPMDTISWSCGKVVCTGVKLVSDVPYLHSNPSPSPRITMNNRPINPSSYAPIEFRLAQNYPNPFNPTTTIEFTLGQPSMVTLKIYNILGQQVATLLNRESMDDGDQEIEFNAGNLPSGVYFYQLRAEGIPDVDEGTAAKTFTAVKKMLLLK